MKAVVIGGRLQGVEAAYLAAMAGIECTIIDLDEDAPAAELCHRFVRGDACDEVFLKEQCRGADLVLPACETQEVLNTLHRVADRYGLPLVYDPDAYAVSSSKLESDRMFADLGIPAPVPWPDCGCPVLAKPSGASGSQGVRILDSKDQVRRLADAHPQGDLVLQQYIEGPSYSIEVVGDGSSFAILQTTELFMDSDYDCCQVLAPAGLDTAGEAEFRLMAAVLARKLAIRGIFDIEVIRHEGRLKILEIDARLPSQTPTAVYHSSGVNMLELLLDLGRGKPVAQMEIREDRACLYEHIHVRGGDVAVRGEHCMGQYGRLHLESGFFGADTAITSYRPGAGEWVATMIFQGASREELLERHRRMLADVAGATQRSFPVGASLC